MSWDYKSRSTLILGDRVRLTICVLVYLSRAVWFFHIKVKKKKQFLYGPLCTRACLNERGAASTCFYQVVSTLTKAGSLNFLQCKLILYWQSDYRLASIRSQKITEKSKECTSEKVGEHKNKTKAQNKLEGSLWSLLVTTLFVFILTHWNVLCESLRSNLLNGFLPHTDVAKPFLKMLLILHCLSHCLLVSSILQFHL